MKAWNDWVHCSGSTYEKCLRGDPKGWRSRRHQEHFEGDYNNPPPKGKYDKEDGRSKQLMKGEWNDPSRHEALPAQTRDRLDLAQ